MFGRGRFLAFLAGIVFLLPTPSHATSCDEIIDTGTYGTSSYFTKGPGYVGCWIGQGVGGLLGAPVTVVYGPIAHIRGVKKGEDSGSPTLAGAEYVGRVLSVTVGLPFFILETIFTGDKEK